MKHERIIGLLSKSQAGRKVTVCAWVRTLRNDRFLAVNDGSSIHNLQLVLDPESLTNVDFKKLNTGASICASGQLVESQGKGQETELIVQELEILGESDPTEYPMQMKRHSMEFLREKAHLRFRTSTFGAVFRLRHGMTFAVHQFFHERGYFNLHTPIVTGSDAEGAGEMFKVTTLDLNDVPRTEDKEVDYSQDFFGKASNLTVSGQLEAELGAMALGKVYTFGPTFRAENSNTSRHLAEFWMIEPELAFADLNDDMDLAEEFLKYLLNYALEKHSDEIDFLTDKEINDEKSKPQAERNEMPLRQRLEFVMNNDFERITYTEAIDLLRNSKPFKKKKFKYPVEWGIDLQSEHERFLVEKHFKKPVIISDYPKGIKAFYMRNNDDGKTVAAMDVLVPGIGEIIGGSQREERLEQLLEKCKDFDIPEEHVWWYLELRKFGTAPHCGFGMGFERLIMFVTGMTNIRDVIPFPRTPQSAEF